jgi:hypothetical protein
MLEKVTDVNGEESYIDLNEVSGVVYISHYPSVDEDQPLWSIMMKNSSGINILSISKDEADRVVEKVNSLGTEIESIHKALKSIKDIDDLLKSIRS